MRRCSRDTMQGNLLTRSIPFQEASTANTLAQTSTQLQGQMAALTNQKAQLEQALQNNQAVLLKTQQQVLPHIARKIEIARLHEPRPRRGPTRQHAREGEMEAEARNREG